jgi:hypothetical protein
MVAATASDLTRSRASSASDSAASTSKDPRARDGYIDVHVGQLVYMRQCTFQLSSVHFSVANENGPVCLQARIS